MYYKIMELISKKDTFNLFTDFPSTNNLAHITKNLSRYTRLDTLETDIRKIFEITVGAFPYNSIYYVEGVKLLEFTRRLFEQAKELKKEDFKMDYTDEIIRIYGEGLEGFVEGVEVVNEHVNYVLK